MAHIYYCTHCGKLLSQETVLFDLQYLLTRQREEKFKLLKFRLTQKELRELIAGGKEDKAGYRQCTISFKNVMAIIANDNNLGEGRVHTDPQGARFSDKDIANLTLEQIDAYLRMVECSCKKWDDDPFAEDPNMPGDEENVARAPVAAGILALETKNFVNTDKAYTQELLGADLRILRELFAGGESCTFSIRPQEETDNDGNKVLVGYDLAFGGSVGQQSVDARVCNNRECGAKVFKHAGTAKHQAVAFIGYQSAGKTSTILALAHYARQGMTHKLAGHGDAAADIWKDAKVFDNLVVELVDKDDSRLAADLSKFTQGVAPNKAEPIKCPDPYCATFRIKNRGMDKYYLITLIDLPDDLYEKDGTVDEQRIRSNFPVAMTCDAFVMCVDASSLDAESGSTSQRITNLFRWTEGFQQMRAEYNRVKLYVPTMLLFTKCTELEEAAPLEVDGFISPVQKMFYLRDEKACIEKNILYSSVIEAFNHAGELPNAYHAMMRCSSGENKAPFGKGMDDPNKAWFRNEQPKPRNIDKLMYWLLCVSGCIPAEVTLVMPGVSDRYTQREYCLDRPQLRSEALLSGPRFDEAMVRCFLFENPGKLDVRCVTRYNSAFGRWKCKIGALFDKGRDLS